MPDIPAGCTSTPGDVLIESEGIKCLMQQFVDEFRKYQDARRGKILLTLLCPFSLRNLIAIGRNM